ncbi:MAG TPA: hypothetical protein PLG26_14430, partial [Verrucomicrobiota bacterium]|nr:hypothetical protein [Verrucomicrobiota bacterium]HPV12382.1 hypothetical protein [Verrucomicrobiota bacterium]
LNREFKSHRPDHPPNQGVPRLIRPISVLDSGAIIATFRAGAGFNLAFVDKAETSNNGHAHGLSATAW